jgi:Phosphoglucomutase/phosphomannomutase, alpha/beta/alpha domain I
MRINPFIFRAYDVRGKVGVDVTPEVFREVGRADATLVRAKGGRRVALGMDNRLTSPPLKEAFAVGVSHAGRNMLWSAYARCGAEPGGPDVHAVTWLAALAPKHSGIGCRTKQSIPAEDDSDNRTQGGESKRLDVGTRGRSRVGMGCKTSQGSRSYTGQPIQWPNCSWTDKSRK